MAHAKRMNSAEYTHLRGRRAASGQVSFMGQFHVFPMDGSAWHERRRVDAPAQGAWCIQDMTAGGRPELRRANKPAHAAQTPALALVSAAHVADVPCHAMTRPTMPCHAMRHMYGCPMQSSKQLNPTPPAHPGCRLPRLPCCHGRQQGMPPGGMPFGHNTTERPTQAARLTWLPSCCG